MALCQLELVSWVKMPREQHLALWQSQQPEGLEALQLKLGTGQENFSATGEAAATAEILADRKEHLCCCPSGPSAFSGRKKDCHLLSTANTQPVNFFPVNRFLPSYTILIHFLLAHFTLLTLNLPAAAAPDLIPPLSLSALTGLPIPSSVSAATALPCSPPWLTTPNPDKGHGKIHI